MPVTKSRGSSQVGCCPVKAFVTYWLILFSLLWTFHGPNLACPSCVPLLELFCESGIPSGLCDFLSSVSHEGSEETGYSLGLFVWFTWIMVAERCCSPGSLFNSRMWNGSGRGCSLPCHFVFKFDTIYQHWKDLHKSLNQCSLNKQCILLQMMHLHYIQDRLWDFNVIQNS